jgi:putative peptidoglycan lipid II flippase
VREPALARHLVGEGLSDDRRIARAVASVALFVVIAKLCAAAKEMAVAWRYGVSGTVDAYQLAMTLVQWLPMMLFTMAYAVLVPLLVRTRHDPTDQYQRFLGELNGMALALGVVLIGFGALAWPYAIDLLASGLADATRELAWSMTRQLLPVSAFVLFVGLFSIRLQARERHVNTLLESLPPLTLVPMLVFWPAGGTAGTPLIWGTLLGMALQIGFLAWFAKVADGCLGLPDWRPLAPQWTEVWRALRFLAFGQVAMGFIEPIDQFTAARLGDHSIATLGYANRILALLMSLGSIAVARAVLPILSEALVRDSHARGRALALRWTWSIGAVGVITALAAWLLMPSLVALLFQRGAFGAEDTLMVASVARWALLQLPFFLGGMVLLQLLTAMGRFREIAAVALLNLGIKLVLNMALAPQFGLVGIVIASACMYLGGFVFFLWKVTSSENEVS